MTLPPVIGVGVLRTAGHSTSRKTQGALPLEQRLPEAFCRIVPWDSVNEKQNLPNKNRFPLTTQVKRKPTTCLVTKRGQTESAPALQPASPFLAPTTETRPQLLTT
jgi:hypothetical protein